MAGRERFDIWIAGCVLALVAVGILANYSTSYASGEAGFSLFHRQLLWSGIGLVAMILAAGVRPRHVQSLAYLVYVAGVAALLAVLLVGQTQMGAKRWIGLGPFQLQPSELAKLTTLVGLARLLSDFPRDLGRPWLTLMALAMGLLPMALVLVEPDLGTSLIFPMLLFCMLAWAGIPVWHLLLLLSPVIAVTTSWHTTLHLVSLVLLLLALLCTARKPVPVILGVGLFLLAGSATPLLWHKLHPYQQQRLLTFINPEADPLGSAYQLIQSKIAVGSGGLTGKGFLAGTQSQLKFLPEGHTDFIFSAWAEEFGFLGTTTVCALFFTLFYRGVHLAARCHNPFYSLVALGVVAMLSAQALMNLSMTVGLLPVAGVPLPFISYGGSSLITWMTLAGLLLGISLRWRDY